MSPAASGCAARAEMADNGSLCLSVGLGIWGVDVGKGAISDVVAWDGWDVV